jgi:hypothetical protein
MDGSLIRQIAENREFANGWIASRIHALGAMRFTANLIQAQLRIYVMPANRALAP